MEATSGKTVLIVEDERDVVDLLALNLRKAGFSISMAMDGAAGLQKARGEKPAFVILDLMLPKMPGLEICKILKSDPATRQIPIMMLTAKAEETDQVVGFSMGADDYVTKPFSVKVLLQRIKVLLRRHDNPEPSGDVIESVGIRIDKRAHQVTVNEGPITLTPTEFRLLETLMKQPGRAFTRHDLMDAAVGDAIVLERTIDVHIKTLRRKLGPAGEHLETVRGVGYRFRA